VSIAKTNIVSYTRKTNFLSDEYQLCHATITRTSSIEDLGVFFDSKSHFHSHVDYVFYECIKILGLIRSITAVRLKESPPKDSQIIIRDSVADLPSFTQNLMQTRCSILRSIADKAKHEVEKILV
jgi:hypothetical protein